MCSSTAKFGLFFVYVLFAIFIGPAIFGDSQQRKRTFRVHFYRKPDGPWLSLLNFRVVQQNFDHDLEDEMEDGETETAEEDYDDDAEDDGWTIIEFDNSEEKRNTTEEKLRKQNDRINGSGRDEDGKWKEWDIGRDEKEERGKEKGRDGEEDARRKIEDDQTDDARKMKQGRDKAKEGGRDEEKGLLANDQRPDVALFKQLIIPWVPHRLRHHHHPLHHSHSSQIQGTHTEQSSNGTIIVTEQNVNKTMPEQNANVSEEVAQRETGSTKTPSTTGGTAKADVKLHLEDILIFGAFVTPSGEETKETAKAETENGNGTIWGQDRDQKDDPMAPLRNDLSNSGQKVLLNGTSLGKPTPATTTTGTSTTWAPINEEELAMNQHVDPLGRDRQQFLAQLIARSNNVSDEAEEDELRETYRDLGGSFILPLLKERKYDNKSVPLVFPDMPLRVALSLEVLHLGNFDNFQMEYELDVLVRLRWIDVRLANNFSKPIRIREQKIIDRIWKPDAVFLNSKFSYFHMVTFPNFRMRILPDGHVSFTTRITLLPDCQMNFCNFPHDSQRCGLYISSIAHPKTMLDLQWEPLPILFPRKISLPDLRIKRMAGTNCQLPGKLIPSSCLALVFELKRDSARYVAERYMPSILAMIFSWVAPYVPYNYEEVRIITPITVLLTLVQMEKGNQEVITSYLTSLDIWFVVIKAFTVLSLIESLAVMAYIKKGRAVESEAQRAPSEYRRDLLQAEVKRIERLYHRLDHLTMALSPVAFLLFLGYYVQFVVQRDLSSCMERHVG